MGPIFPLFDQFLGGYGQQPRRPSYMDLLQPPQPEPFQFDRGAARKQGWRDAAMVAGQGLTAAAFGQGDVGQAISQGIGAFRGSQDQAYERALAEHEYKAKAAREAWRDQLSAAQLARGFAGDEQDAAIRQGQLGLKTREMEMEMADKERQRAALAKVLGFLPQEEQPKAQAALDSGIKGATDQIFKLLYPEPDKPDAPREPKRGFIKGPDGKTYMFGLTPVKDDGDGGEEESSKAALTQSSYIAAYDRRYNQRYEQLRDLRETQYRAAGTKATPAQKQKDEESDQASAAMWAREQMQEVSKAWGEQFGRKKPPPAEPPPGGETQKLKELPAALGPAAEKLAQAKGISVDQARQVLLQSLTEQDAEGRTETVASILRKLGL